MKKRPPHVSCYYTRHGKLWWRFRAKGKRTCSTNALFDSAEWWAWYSAAAAGDISTTGGAGLERSKPGSVAALVALYYTSADFKLLSASTQRTYRGIIDRFRTDHGDKPVSRLRAEDVRRMVDARADKPAAAGNFLKVVRLLMAMAVERGWRTDNPAKDVRAPKYRSDGFHTWDEAEIAAFEKRWAVGTTQRLAFDLLLYTAQRSWDVRGMGVQHVKADQIAVRQHKTGRSLMIPIHPQLGASLAAAPKDQLTFVVTQFGAPYTEKGFSNFITDAANAAGLSGCSAHGLRKAAATRLAQAGCTAHEIQAMTGHTTLKEVERYTRAADQNRQARAAMAKILGPDKEQKSSNLTDELDKRPSNRLKRQ